MNLDTFMCMDCGGLAGLACGDRGHGIGTLGELFDVYNDVAASHGA